MEVDQRKVKEDKEKSNFTDPQLLADNAVAQTKFINPDSKELSFKIFPILLYLFSLASVFFHLVPKLYTYNTHEVGNNVFNFCSLYGSLDRECGNGVTDVII